MLRKVLRNGVGMTGGVNRRCAAEHEASYVAFESAQHRLQTIGVVSRDVEYNVVRRIAQRCPDLAFVVPIGVESRNGVGQVRARPASIQHRDFVSLIHKEPHQMQPYKPAAAENECLHFFSLLLL